MVIKLLDKETINKIAAGEVIERPKSVVKELIENSIDADATQITVEIKNAGKDLIKVVDNGSGMDELDLKKAFLRHATSKISNFNDLFNIHTLGFRGEALSSIAAISKLRISSKTEEEDLGNLIYVVNERIIEHKKIALTKGTIVEVEELFYNTPARKKYLKTNETELNHIIDLITRYGFVNEEVAFKLIADNKTLLNIPNTSLRNKIVSVYGKDTAKNLIEVRYKDSFAEIFGLISKPYLTRTDKSHQTLFVNGRYVKNYIVTKAIYDAYHTFLFLDRNPVFVLFINLDPRKTDVNIHPTKDIIKVDQENRLYNSVYNALKNAFKNNNLIPEVNLNEFSTAGPVKAYPIERTKQTLLSETTNVSFNSLSDVERFIEQKKNSIKTSLGPIKILGQINKLYIIAESPQGLTIIDQHAAEERINFEALLNQYKSKGVEKQKLLRAVEIELDIKQFNIIEQNIELLDKMGFEIEPLSRRSFALKQVPRLLNASTNDFIDLIKDLSNLKSIEELTEDKIASKACRMSIKAGDTLTMPEMYKLIERLELCEKPYTCPHGRPTIISFSLGELEKKFKRRVF
jgi:DNA mismatch repair protein MutL